MFEAQFAPLAVFGGEEAHSSADVTLTLQIEGDHQFHQNRMEKVLSGLAFDVSFSGGRVGTTKPLSH